MTLRLDAVAGFWHHNICTLWAINWGHCKVWSLPSERSPFKRSDKCTNIDHWALPLRWLHLQQHYAGWGAINKSDPLDTKSLNTSCFIDNLHQTVGVYSSDQSMLRSISHAVSSTSGSPPQSLSVQTGNRNCICCRNMQSMCESSMVVSFWHIHTGGHNQ